MTPARAQGAVAMFEPASTPAPAREPDWPLFGTALAGYLVSYGLTVGATSLFYVGGVVGGDTLGLSLVPVAGPWTTLGALWDDAWRSDRGGLLTAALVASLLQLGGIVAALIALIEGREVAPRPPQARFAIAPSPDGAGLALAGEL